MRDNRSDKTISEYELVKANKHPKFRFAQDFYAFHGVNRQTFSKYYNRHRASGGNTAALLPAKRGPRWRTRRTLPFIEQLVLAQRSKGNDRYDIFAILKPTLGDHTPKPSTIYAILERHGVAADAAVQAPDHQDAGRRVGPSRLPLPGQGPDRRQQAPPLPRLRGGRRARLAWAEVVDDLKALSVMFAALKCLNMLAAEHGVRFEALLTDNGAEVASRRNAAGQHPLWRTLNEDLLDGTTFETVDELKEELALYLLYSDTERPHQGLGGKPPLQAL